MSSFYRTFLILVLAYICDAYRKKTFGKTIRPQVTITVYNYFFTFLNFKFLEKIRI